MVAPLTAGYHSPTQTDDRQQTLLTGAGAESPVARSYRRDPRPVPTILEGDSGDVDAGLQLTFIGTATVLLRCEGFTLLTDPNFLHRGERAYVGLGVSTKRLTAPALTVEDLPALDFVVLSHHHGDHFDHRAASGLRKDLPIVTNAGAARKLRSQGFSHSIPLANWGSHTFQRGDASVAVTSVPARHAPSPFDRLLPPVMGSVLDFRRGAELTARVYITGDTLLDERLAEIPARLPGIDLCIIHLGGTRIAGVLLTMDGSQGVEALRIIRPKRAVPVHYDDYTLFRSPLRDFTAALDAQPVSAEVTVVERGDTYTISTDELRVARR
jgi:L-ascorbate metabolism protein UlaG (beta-lactamase superfamily)